MASWWEDYKKRKGLSSGGSDSQAGKTYNERMTTDEHRQAAKSSAWWEDYKKKNDLERKAAADRQRAAYMEKKRALDQQSYTQYTAAQRQLEENKSRDAAEDEIRELFRNPFSSDAEWQARVLERAASRYERDFPLYQETLKRSAYSPALYNRSYSQATGAYNDLIAKRDSYTTTMKKAEEERNKSNLVNRPAQWQAENLSPQEIERRLAYYRSEASTPTVTDKDREARAYLYPEAALQKDPHGARFDERLVEDAGQDAVDAAYKPILTEQEKAAVEEADQQIIKEKAERNYEQVQRLLAAQAGQTETVSRARGNELIEEIAQGGEAANKAKTGKALFEQQQKKIDEESPTIIYGARGNYSSAMAERTKRGYILGSDWDNVPDDRKQAVYALYTESPEKAIELAKFYIADVRQAEDEELQAWYAQSGWTAELGLVSSAAAHLGSAVDPFGPVGQELTRYGDNALAGGSQWADAATGYQKIPEWVPVVGGKGAGDLYQTVGSVVQSAAVAAPAILAGRYDQAAAEVLSKLGLALMGSSAAASDYRESVAAGMDEDRAKLHALAAGVEEALFEEVSLDKLIKMDTSGGLKAALKNWLVQSGIEGSEELATSIANRITDEMISGAGQSKVERRASELIANGMNSTEAHTQAENEWMTDTLYEGFSGFLSGGMMTGENYALQGLANLKGRAVNAVETRKAQKQAGAAVSRSEGSVEAIQAYAKDNGIEIKAVETAEQNAEENAEQGGQGANQNSYSSRDYRAISDTNSKVVQSIRNEVRGKTVQEQQAVRDSLVEKYGEGIAPVVNNAISIETAARVRQEYGDVDSIQAARNQAVSEIKDESLRQAVSDGYDSAAYSIAASQGGEDGMNTMSRYIQQRRNTGSGSEMSMNATVTTQDGSTKTIAITGMSEDGKRVSLADGSEVAVKDLQADADTTSAIQQLADLDLGADATKVLQAYQQSGVSGTEGYRWLMDYATAYNQGRTRQISLEQAAQRSSLDERTVMDAYTLGQQAANRETQAGLEKLKNLPKRKGASGRTANIDTTEIKGKTMSKSELEQFELANQYAQALGVDMKWFSSKEKDGKFVGKNGAYENGKIYMDIHAGRNFAADLTSGILATMGHELSHFEQQYAPEEYQALKEFLFEQIVKSSPNGEARLERLIWEKQRRSGNTLSRKAAEDEVVADACQKMLRDSKAVHDFASQQPGAANSLVRWLDKWFKRVRSIFGRGGNYSEEAQLMDSLEQDVKAAFGELWDKALKQAAKVHDEVGNIEKATTEGESKAQNSDRDAEYLELAKNPEKNAARLQEMVDEAAERAGYTIKAYHGTTENFTQFSQEKQGQNHKGYLEFGAGFYFTPSEKEARNWAERGKNGPARAKDSKVMAVYLNPGRIIEADATIPGGKEYLEGMGLTEEDASFVANRAYRFINYLLEDKGYSNVEVQDRLKAMGFDAVEDTYRNRSEGQYVVFAPEQIKSADPVTYDDSGNVIPLSERFNKANEDIRYSERPATDSTGRELSEGQQEYFKDSKIRDKYGNLLTLYHGTASDFTVFDLGRSGKNYDGWSEYGIGIYLTPDKKFATYFSESASQRGGTPKLMELYANIKNPFNANDPVTVDVSEYAKKYKLTEDDVKFLKKIGDRWLAFMREHNEDIYDFLTSHGYDGFWDAYGTHAPTQIVAFTENQVKNVDNLNPTDNPDIRYSERDYSTPSDEELLMNARVEDAANVEQGRLLEEYQALGKRISTLEKQLAEAKRQTQLTNRALNTRGIGNVVKTVMQDYDITDARHNGTAKNATLALTEGYQKALDLLDKGASPAEVNDAVYNGAVKAAEIILEQGTYSQNLGGKWQVYSASRYLGENSQELIDSFVSEAYADFVSNRYREARPETAADRLVARTKKEAQERVDKYKGRSDALAEANRRLEEKTTQAESEAKEARKAAGELFLEIKDLRQELMDNKTMSEQERKAASKKLKALNKSLEAKREEAASWQKRAKRNASLLKSALESKNRDISALNNRLSKEQAAALEKQKSLEAKLEKKIQRYRDILAGKANSPELNKLLKAEREKTEARVKEQKEQVFQNYKERKKAGELRGRIKNLSDEMKRRMTNPTDRAYVPASLYQSMTKLADVLDNVLSPNPGTKAEARYRAMMDAIRGMAREYEDVKNLDPVFASEYEQEISDAIGEIERILERKNASWIDGLTGDTQKSFAELNSDELQQLYDLMRQINYTITNATKVFGNSNYKSIFDAQRAVAEQQNSMKSLNAVSRLERKKRLRLLNGLSVMRATEMMAGWDRSAALYQLMHGIEQGADDAWAWVMDYNKSMQDLKTGKNEKEYRQALTKQLDFGITDRDGLKVTMTKMQALQILMTAEREEHNDKLLHLQAGGAVIRNAIDLQNGKGAKARSQTISVTPELIQKIGDSLTEWDKAYMKTVRDYFKREGKRTNEILYKLKHKVLKTEEFYVPYTVDRNYLEANLNEQQALNMWVKTPGSTNALKQKAKQPVIIDGMDTVMGQHVKEIGNYIGMAIPIRDFSKVYNGMIPTEGPNPLPVKETIERTFGKTGQHLLTQAVIDVQGGTARQNWESNIAQFLNKLQGAFVKSALLINPSVTIKQAASYIAAESVISHLALERGNHSVWARTDESKSFMPGGLIAQLFARPEGKTAQRIYNEIDQYTSLHYQRRQGMSMAEIAEQANRTGPIKRRINAIGASMEQSKIGHVARRTGENLNPLTWIQRMDVATTAALWVACKEQAKLDKLAVGSEEFWKRTTELYERCIRETQPMYDGLHRTANQKQAGGLMQYLFPFRTVPIQNHGQLAASYEAYKAARESKNEAKIKEAGKFFRKTVWAQTESAFVFSAMTFLAAILKRKTKKYRDEEGEFDAGSFTKGLLTDVGSTLISVLNPMYGSELFNLGSRAVDKFEGNSGYTYDAFSVGVVDMINDLASSGDRLLADAGKIVRGENVNAADFWNHAMNLLVKGGKLAGIPADTVKTYFEGTKGNIQDAIEGRIPALNDESWERDAATNARRYLKAYLDNDTKKASAVLAELRSNLSKSGKGEDKINEAIRKAVSAQAIEKVADGTWTEEEAEAYLLSTGAYDDRENPQKDAWNAIRKGIAKSTSTDEEFNWKQYDDLSEAVANGEDVTDILTEYRNHGYSDDQINGAIKSGIQEALTAGDLDGNEAADALIRYGVTYSKNGKDVVYDEQTAWKKVQEWEDKAEHTDEEGELEDGYKYSAYTDLFEAVDANQNADGVIQTMVQNGGYDTDSLRGKIKEHLLERFIAGQITETALKNQLSRYCKISKADDANEIVANAKCKRDFGVYPDDLKEAFKDGDLSQNQAEKALQQYKGLSKADAQNRVQYWGYDGDLSENAWAKWAHELKSTGLSVDNWEKVYKVKSSAKGTDANGDGRADSGTVKAEVVFYIDGMNIPKSQKKAIYLAFGWAASTMPNWR